MKRIVYVHGFASAGSTGTAVTMRNLLYKSGVEVLSPDVPVMPREAIDFLRGYVQRHGPDLIVATSMGALYAEQLAGTPRILVNPSFHMARHLTFGGMGRREFRNKREDGARDFKVDKEMIAQFRDVEARSFADPRRAEVWGLFGKQDKLVNCQADFRKHYGTAQMQLFDGEHYLNDRVLSRVVLPLATQILSI